MLKIEMIKLKNLVISEVKIREVKKEHEKYQEMKLSVAKHGVVQPILARPYRDEHNKIVPNMWEITDGWQRWNVLNDLKGLEAEIPTRIMEQTDEEAQVMQSFLNTHRVPQKLKEMLEQLKKFIFSHPQYSNSDIADLFCMKLDDYYRILKLDNLCEAAMELANNGTIKATSAFALSTIPKEHQTDDLIKKAMSEASGDFVNTAAAYKKALKVAEAAGKKTVGPIIVPRPKTRAELIKIWETAKAIIESTDPDAENYLYLQGGYDMIQEVLQVDPETLATKAALVEQAKATAAAERAEKRAKMANDALAAVKATQEKIKESAIAGIN